MRHVYSALCWLGWFCNRGGRFHTWAQRRYLYAKYPPDTWIAAEDLKREYEIEERT
jgi:hypothetical protein